MGQAKSFNYREYMISRMHASIKSNETVEAKINTNDIQPTAQDQVIVMDVLYQINLKTKRFEIAGHICPFCRKVLQHDDAIKRHPRVCKKLED